MWFLVPLRPHWVSHTPYLFPLRTPHISSFPAFLLCGLSLSLSHWSWYLLIWLFYFVKEPPGASCLCSCPHAGIGTLQGASTPPCFYLGASDLNSDLHAHFTHWSILPLWHSPTFVFINFFILGILFVISNCWLVRVHSPPKHYRLLSILLLTSTI